MMHRSHILQLQPSQIEEVSELAANALISDPVFSYLTPDDPKLRFQALTWLTSRLMAYCIQYGYTHTTSDLQGVAVWLPPSGEFSSYPLQQLKIVLQLQLYKLPVKVGWNRLARWLNVLYAIEKAQQQDMGESPYWDLGLMVVHPDSQGQGIGTRLLQPILLRARDEGLPCSVVTATELAVRFYQKNGFKVTRKQPIAADKPSFWILKRHP
ncbi:GNAT family N-acetyltransferase [Acaryochloris marina NIES-2412]|uniref:GNAT family N-acetyltransferase n=1 Tax=Acaryochloris marina TaxID=155978 RepID=UPI00405A35C7